MPWDSPTGAVDAAADLPAQVTFSVVGIPVQQGSMRACVVKGHAVVRHEKGKSLTDWRLRVGQAAGATGWPRVEAEPVFVECTFAMLRPRAHWGTRGLLPSAPRVPASTPDIDKLGRAMLDALTGVLYTDDRQVSELVLRKVYAELGQPAGVVVTVGYL